MTACPPASWNGKREKQVQLMPFHDEVSLIAVLPERLQLLRLTVEWEYRLGEVEREELVPEDFMVGASAIF